MQVADDVLRVLSQAQLSGNALTLVGQLDRKLYERTNKVLEAAGGRWTKKAKAHLFDGPADERIDQIILTRSVEIPKDEFNYFPTPASLARPTAELAWIDPGMTLLEPSAGQGALAKEALLAGALVDCVELMPANVTALQAISGLRMVIAQDFLSLRPEPVYDRVLANPPFVKQADIKHVTHALGFLKPGGRLVAIMAGGVSFRQDARAVAFRDLVSAHDGVIMGNPEGSFKESGTGVNTVTVVMNVPA